MIFKSTLFISVMTGSIIAGLIYQPAFAVSNQPNGLAVSPAVNNIQLKAGQNTTTITENIANITNTNLAVYISTKDFSALNSSGSIGFYGSNYKISTNSHELSSVIELPVNEIYIEAHKSQSVTITINNLSTLSPGGHYAALLFTPFISRNIQTNNQINVQPAVASLIFLTTAGGGVKEIKSSGLSVASIGFTLPKNAYLLLSNTGNIQLTPYGIATLTDYRGVILSRDIINSNSGLILPSTSRLFNISFNNINDYLKPPGIYKIQIKYRYEGSSSYQTINKYFFYLNPIFLVYIIIFYIIVKYIIRSHRDLKPKPSTSSKIFTKKS